MSPIAIGILGCVLLVILLFLGMPITFVMMFVGFLGIWSLSGLDAALSPLSRVPCMRQLPITPLPSYPFLCSWGALRITLE